MLHKDELDAWEEDLRTRVRALPDDQRKSFYSRLNKRVKDPDSYAVLNYLFITGLHHFYLGKWVKGAVDLVVLIAGLACIFMGQIMIGIALIIGITVIELYALFRAQAIVQDYNCRLMEELLSEVGSTPADTGESGPGKKAKRL